jgi:hypothetical protein
MFRIFSNKQRSATPLLIAGASLFFLVGIGMSEVLPGTGLPVWLHPTAAAPAPVAVPQSALPDFTALVKNLRPVVVNISTTQEGQDSQLTDPFGSDRPVRRFLEPLLRRPTASEQAAPTPSGFGVHYFR